MEASNRSPRLPLMDFKYLMTSLHDIQIRKERNEDVAAIRQLTMVAFSNTEWGHQGEADLVEALRDRSSDFLSLVAETHKGNLFGHIMFSSASIETIGNRNSTTRPVSTGMALAPMSVAPQYQKKGIGSQLVLEGLKILNTRDVPFVLVLGHPSYYPRFDFQPAKSFDLYHGFDGIPQDVFFVKFLDRTVELEGDKFIGRYLPQFGPQKYHEST